MECVIYPSAIELKKDTIHAWFVGCEIEIRFRCIVLPTLSFSFTSFLFQLVWNLYISLASMVSFSIPSLHAHFVRFLTSLKSPAVQFAIISVTIALIQTLLQAEVWLASRNAGRVLQSVADAPQVDSFHFWDCSTTS